MVIVITNGSSEMSLIILRSLVKEDQNIIVIDNYKSGLAINSKYCNKAIYMPANSEKEFIEQFIPFLENLKTKEKKINLIPVSYETEYIYNNFKKISKLCNIIPNNTELTKTLFNKEKAYNLFVKEKIPVPPYTIVKSIEDIDKFHFKKNKEYILKIPQGFSSLGVKRLKTKKSAKIFFKKFTKEFNINKLILQDFIEGKIYSTGILTNEGEIISSITYETIFSYPPKNGCAICRSSVEFKIPQEIKQFLKKYQWNGIIQYDLIKTKDNYYIIDINPRFFGGLFHAVANNVDLPKQYFQLLTNKPIETTLSQKSIQTGSFPLTIMAILNHLLKGQIKELSKVKYLKNFKDDWLYDYKDLNIFLGFNSVIQDYFRQKKIISNNGNKKEFKKKFRQ